MLNIKGILSAVLKDLQENPDNIMVMDDQHFIDKLAGVEYHLYDDYFQMTQGDDTPVTVSHFSKAEQDVIMSIKDMITDPEVSADKKQNYKLYQQEARERFSSWYEKPIPIEEGITEEEDTDEYVR